VTSETLLDLAKQAARDGEYDASVKHLNKAWVKGGGPHSREILKLASELRGHVRGRRERDCEMLIRWSSAVLASEQARQPPPIPTSARELVQPDKGRVLKYGLIALAVFVGLGVVFGNMGDESGIPTSPVDVVEQVVGDLGQDNATRQAESYLRSQAFSRSGLIDQLMFEGYSRADATHAVNTVDVDWYEQAALKAESYLRSQAFSRQGLIDQLVFEGFTQAQATYGVRAVGY
jgi:hypothetical protein